MVDKPTENGKTKILQTVVGVVLAAVLTSSAGMMYRHEVGIIAQKRDTSQLQARLYRERIRNYEYHERYMRAIIQLIELRKNKEGLSIVDKSRLNFFVGQQEMIQEEKDNYIETWKSEGQ